MTTGPEQITVDRTDDLGPSLAAHRIPLERPVLVVIGGAAGLSETVSSPVAALFSALAPELDRLRAVVVDGGTDSGVMRILGRARAAAGATFPLVGVAAAGTVGPAGTETVTAPAEPGHTHLVLVPGDSWGDESPWLSATADAVAGARPSVTLLINGGTITLGDALTSLAARRPVLVIDGTGRAADDIARAHAAGTVAESVGAIAASPLTHILSIHRPREIVAAITAMLAPA